MEGQGSSRGTQYRRYSSLEDGDHHEGAKNTLRPNLHISPFTFTAALLSIASSEAAVIARGRYLTCYPDKDILPVLSAAIVGDAFESHLAGAKRGEGNRV